MDDKTRKTWLEVRLKTREPNEWMAQDPTVLSRLRVLGWRTAALDEIKPEYPVWECSCGLSSPVLRPKKSPRWEGSGRLKAVPTKHTLHWYEKLMG